MPTIEHSVLSGSELHEPKGISSASDGQIYVANGSGGGVWEDQITNVHGEMVVINNATATAVTAAADATLNTDSDYVKITAGWTGDHLHNVSFNTDELILSKGGFYYISFWCSIKVPTNNNFVSIKYAINDTAPYSNRKIKSQSVTANDYINMSATGILDSITADDTLSMYIAATKTDNIVIEEAGLCAMLLHPA